MPPAFIYQAKSFRKTSGFRGARGESGRDPPPAPPRITNVNFSGDFSEADLVVVCVSRRRRRPSLWKVSHKEDDDDSDFIQRKQKVRSEEQAYNEPLSIGAGCASSQLLPLLCCAVHEGRSAQRGSSFPKVAFVGEYWRSSARSLLRRNLEDCAPLGHGLLCSSLYSVVTAQGGFSLGASPNCG